MIKGYTPKTEFVVQLGTAKDAAGAIAKTATSSEASAARVIRAAESKTNMGELIDMPALVEELRQLTQRGGTGGPEAMLAGQATALQTLFTILIELAMQRDELQQFQVLFDAALRAQRQCRSTLATLVEIRNPKRATQFIRQQNNALNQQVVNSSGAAEIRKIPDSGTDELLEVDHAQGRRLDAGAAALAIPDDAGLAAVGKIHRTPDPRRQGP